MGHSITANVKVFAMAGYSLNVQPVQMPDLKYFAEDNICSLIINVKPEPMLSKDLLPIALTSSPAIANTHVVRSWLSSHRNVAAKEKIKEQFLKFLSVYVIAA